MWVSIPLQTGPGYWSQIYQYHNSQTGFTMAVKIFDANYYHEYEMTREQLEAYAVELFQREILAYKKLWHLQGTVVPKLLGYCSRQLWIAMEYVPNKVKVNRYNYESARRSLQILHCTGGITHGDISLKNMRMRKDGQINFLDLSTCGSVSVDLDRKNLDESFCRLVE